MPLLLRLVGETDSQFSARAERVARIACVLIDAALANRFVQGFISDSSLPYTTSSVRNSPPLRLEYEHATAIGELGTCLRVTKHKTWGAGPYVMPLRPEDPFDPFRVLYVHKPSSVHRRRYEQRCRLKQLLGADYRSLVTAAQRTGKRQFLQQLTPEQAIAIRRRLQISPDDFWQAACGKRFLSFPPQLLQLCLPFAAE